MTSIIVAEAARAYNDGMRDSCPGSPPSSISDLDRLVGRVAGAICTTLADRLHPRLNCMLLTPVLTYKVKHRLSRLPSPAPPKGRIATVAKLLRSDVTAVLRLYELDPETIVDIEPAVEAEIKKALADVPRRPPAS